MARSLDRRGFTLIELLVVIAIIAILAVVVILTLNPAQLLAQSRDSQRLGDMATLSSALNLYVTDQTGAGSFNLGSTASTGISIYDPASSSTCGSLGLPSLVSSTWYCSTSTSSRNVNGTGWIPVNMQNISSGAPIGSLPVDPVNQTSTGLFYSYNTNGLQFEVTANLESSKYKLQFATTPSTNLFPEVISGGIPTVSALYNPTGLVDYWMMNEGKGSTTIDSSGSGNNGTWMGAPVGAGGTYYVGGKVGTYAGDFNGSTNYVSTTVAQAFSTFTMAAWVQPTTIQFGGIIDKFSLGATYSGFALGWDQNSFGGYFSMLTASGGVSYDWLNSTTSYPLNQWYFVAGTYNGTQKSLYINGVLVSTDTVAFANAATTSIMIGVDYATAPTHPFPGYLDELRVYNRALSSAEIMALYDAEK